MSALQRAIRVMIAVVLPALAVLALDMALEHSPFRHRALASPALPASDRTVGAGCTYATIAAAISAAANGDRLLLEGNRTFTEPVVVTKSLTLRGGYSGCASGVSKPTTINGGDVGSSVFINASVYFTIENIRLTGGSALSGGGLRILPTTRATVTLDNVDIFSNTAASLGGGIHADTGVTLILTGVRVLNNTAAHGGGVSLESSTLRGLSVTVDGNRSSAPGGKGGGFYLSGSRADLFASTIASNTLSGATGARGGGVSLVMGSGMTLTGSQVQRNVVLGADGGGGGIAAVGGHVRLFNTDIVSNENLLGAGGGIFAGGTGSFLISFGSSLIGNQGYEGGGLAVTDTAAVVVNSSYVMSNAAWIGGGAAVRSGSLEFAGQWLARDNTAASDGGGIVVSGGGTLTMQPTGGHSQLSHNRALSGSGGAIYAADLSHLALLAGGLTELRADDNSAAGDGGAIAAVAGTVVDLEGLVMLRGNQAAAGRGGALYLSGGAVATLRATAIGVPLMISNSAAAGGALYAFAAAVDCDGASIGLNGSGNSATGGDGGGLLLRGSMLTATNCSFEGNAATSHGGAVASYTSTLHVGAALTPHFFITGPVTPLDHLACDGLIAPCSVFRHNRADSDAIGGGTGGALYASSSAVHIDQTYLYGNGGLQGGAVLHTGPGGTLVMTNSLLYSNTAASGLGGGIRATAGGPLTLTHVTIANSPFGAALSVSHPPTTSVRIVNSIAWGNAGGGFGATVISGTCNIDQSGTVGAVSDPLFLSPGGGENYRLSPASPVLDMCPLAGVRVDLDGRPRRIGSAYDAGAYEILPHIYLPAVLR